MLDDLHLVISGDQQGEIGLVTIIKLLVLFVLCSVIGLVMSAWWARYSPNFFPVDDPEKAPDANQSGRWALFSSLVIMGLLGYFRSSGGSVSFPLSWFADAGTVVSTSYWLMWVATLLAVLNAAIAGGGLSASIRQRCISAGTINSIALVFNIGSLFFLIQMILATVQLQ